MQTQTTQQLRQPDTIGLEMAIEMTKNWRGFLEKKMGDSFRGFLIPFADIQNIMDIHKDEDIIGVRGYMSLGDQNDPSTVRFIMVPVNSEGKDVLQMPKGEEDDSTTIYDFTQPCPAFCDTTSPLYS